MLVNKKKKKIAIIKEYDRKFSNEDEGNIIVGKLNEDTNFINIPPSFRIYDKNKNNHGIATKWIKDTRYVTIEDIKNNVADMQCISVLDISVGNSDRHFANILIDKNSKLYAIDHDRIFGNFEYIHMPHFEKPLTKKARKYIRSIDIEKNLKILKKQRVEENDIKNYLISTTFLKLFEESSREENLDFGVIVRMMKHLHSFVKESSIFSFMNRWYPFYGVLKNMKKINEKNLKEAFRDEFEKRLNSYKEIGFFDSINQKVFKWFYGNKNIFKWLMDRHRSKVEKN
jgi:hypothetical protein